MRDQPYDGFAAITARWSEGLVGWVMSEKASQSGDLGENSTPERVSADLFDQGLACPSRVFRPSWSRAGSPLERGESG